jgi:hypothetical protein
MVSSPGTSSFTVGLQDGRDWMLRILQSPDALHSRSLLAQKCRDFREDGKQLREWESGFVYGAEQTLRDWAEKRVDPKTDPDSTTSTA